MKPAVRRIARTNSIIAAITAAAGGSAVAHPGHGQGEGGHLHASDVFGLALALAIGAVVWWLVRRK